MTLSVEQAPSEQDLRLVFRVADSGVGVPKDRLPVIFERFTQGDASSSRRYGGAGLGLSICKSLAELMGGGMSAESQVGRGSMFSCTVRLERALDLEPRVTPDCSALTVLVAEDHQPTRAALRELLESWSATVLEACTLDAARRALLKAKSAGGVDLALLDGRLPGLTGPDAATAMRELRELGQETTAYLRLLDTEAARHSPPDEAELFCSTLRKPIKRASLAALLSSFRDAPRPGGFDSAGQRNAPEPSALAPVSILIAEDSEFNAYVIKAYLKSFGQQPTLARNGAQALELYKRNRFDLVLMDVHMPDMDGYAATASIRAYEATNRLKRTPILALTANALAGDAEKSLAAGCDAHLSKPVRKSELIAAIQRFQPASGPEAYATASSDPERITLLIPPELRESARQRLAQLRESADRILLALGLDDLEATLREAELLQTEGAALGLDALSRVGEQLRTAGQNLNPQAVRRAMDELLALLSRVVVS